MRKGPCGVSRSREKRSSRMVSKMGEEAPAGLNWRAAELGTVRSVSPPPMARYRVRSRMAMAVGPLPPPVTSVPEGRFSRRLVRTPARLTNDTRPALVAVLVSETRRLPPEVRTIFWGPCRPVATTEGRCWPHSCEPASKMRSGKRFGGTVKLDMKWSLAALDPQHHCFPIQSGSSVKPLKTR